MDDDSESVLTGVGSVVPSNASDQGLFFVFGSDDLEIWRQDLMKWSEPKVLKVFQVQMFQTSRH